MRRHRNAVAPHLSTCPTLKNAHKLLKYIKLNNYLFIK